MNDIIKNHLRIVNINTAISLLTLVLFITGLGLSISDNIEGTKVVNIIGIIATMVLCGSSFAIHSEHPSNIDNNNGLMNV
jgi:hypothetical protein